MVNFKMTNAMFLNGSEDVNYTLLLNPEIKPLSSEQVQRQDFRVVGQAAASRNSTQRRVGKEGSRKKFLEVPQTVP